MFVTLCLAVFTVVALVWICAVPLYFALTLDAQSIEDFVRRLTDHHSSELSHTIRSLSYLVSQFIMIPGVLILAMRKLWVRWCVSWWFGAVGGLAAGMWASTVLLAVPYLGAWANLLSGLPAILLFGDQTAEPVFHMTIVATNVVIWPLFGSLIFLHQKRKRSPAQVDGAKRKGAPVLRRR